MSIKNYIKAQLDRIDLKQNNSQIQKSLNCIYAVLETRGFSTNTISKIIAEILLNKIKDNIKQLKKIKEDFEKNK